MLGRRTQWTLTNCTVWFECNGFGFPLATDSSHGTVPLPQLPQSSHFSLWPTVIWAQNNNLRRGQYTHGHTHTDTHTHTLPYTRRFQLVSDFNQTFRSFDFGLVARAAAPSTYCFVLCTQVKRNFMSLLLLLLSHSLNTIRLLCAP